MPKLSSLERDLVSQLRESAGEAARAMSASIVIIADPSSLREAENSVNMLMGKRPARLIHIIVGDTALTGKAEPIKAWASARCALDKGKRGVCFEDIFLYGRDASAADPRFWTAFCLRELPSILFWNFPKDVEGLEASDQLFYACAREADLAVIDGSVAIAADIDTPRHLAERILAAKAALSDLAWLRSERYRFAVAALFDEADAGAIRRVEISVADKWIAMLIAGWLKARLRQLDISVSSGQSESLRFTLDGSYTARADFVSPSLSYLTLPSGAKRELGLSSPDDGALWAGLSDTPSADPLYHDALTELTRLQIERAP